ncbi:coagulase domain-containing protein [Staphylococcus agnetis]|uniref:coagulase domain-containing protein n=2 Tax=Staphylococcus agnetis TaxID=985762 RepID=UPI0004E290CD|nr:coagulase domain-containing protein [Staphylococcus agnetis]KFE42459.1 staphylocoagulase [Staphylococcus agnetis]NJH64678.1 coagulase [Staphylococcus agnetis]PTH43487.1 coagulase [Staphylococcus agnetis]PTH72561.1 coagulase [Staphylococcus agnetis]
MKKKLLVLSASAILASNFIFDNSASAVVDVRENPYQSESLKLKGEISHPYDVERYYNSLDDFVYYKSINMHAGYDEPEYKDALYKYKQKFMAEMDALNKYRREQELINKVKGYLYKDKVPSGIYGLTYKRYYSIFENLEKNREEFFNEVRKIESRNYDLKRFDETTQHHKGFEINQLENKILMIGKAFINENPLAVQNLYHQLDMVLGSTNKEYKKMVPTNERMFKIKSQDLESIIDGFFEDINLARPQNIIPLNEKNEFDEQLHKQLRDDAKAAKDNEQLRDPKAKERADKFKKAEEDAKAERAKKAKVSQAKKSSKTKEQKTYKHKQLKKRSESNKESNIKESSSKASNSSYVAPSTQNQQRISTQEKQSKLNNTLPGLSGESNDFTVTHNSKPSGQSKGNSNLIEFSEDTAPKNNELNQQNQTTNAPVVKETITESNIVDIDQSSFYEKSGYKYGYSESDTSGYTERDKRAIRRNHVREAEELVNKYVNSHSYQDRIAAQAKVKTLSQEQQKRLNQQIDKIYNGQ